MPVLAADSKFKPVTFKMRIEIKEKDNEKTAYQIII